MSTFASGFVDVSPRVHANKSLGCQMQDAVDSASNGNIVRGLVAV